MKVTKVCLQGYFLWSLPVCPASETEVVCAWPANPPPAAVDIVSNPNIFPVREWISDSKEDIHETTAVNLGSRKHSFQKVQFRKHIRLVY